MVSKLWRNRPRSIAGATPPTLAPKSRPVDQANRPGTDFTDIQPAVDAARAGDRIRVRNGQYSAPRISKPITVFAEFGGARIGSATQIFTIENIPFGTVCTVAGMVLESQIVIVQICKGTVALSGFAISRGFAPLPTISFTDCDAVTMHGCALKSTIYAFRSRLVMSDSYVLPTANANALMGGLVSDDTDVALSGKQL